ncbi:hypothetical protein E2C01_076956 [Portunus trituberculatus]|uniref:Uncharacterized protein n=1 Tax=Portunus trituberculatus TaxID=210409 RepID=A0A5B7INA6_PORTR|nr:hypothetical protein [Portunus trituberculatus]
MIKKGRNRHHEKQRGKGRECWLKEDQEEEEKEEDLEQETKASGLIVIEKSYEGAMRVINTRWSPHMPHHHHHYHHYHHEKKDEVKASNEKDAAPSNSSFFFSPFVSR